MTTDDYGDEVTHLITIKEGFNQCDQPGCSGGSWTEVYLDDELLGTDGGCYGNEFESESRLIEVICEALGHKVEVNYDYE